MIYISVKEAAEKWQVSERMVRKYCEQGKIDGVIHAGTYWVIPAAAKSPAETKNASVEVSSDVKKIWAQRKKNYHFGIYEYLQENLAYSSCRMASNRLTREQITEIYRTGKLSVGFEPVKVDDVVEVNNHFVACRYMVDTITEALNLSYIRTLHQKLFVATQADLDGVLHIGEYRKTSDKFSSLTSTIALELESLIKEYERKENIALQDILDFHVRFELIHPFEDGNGRVGRMLIIKECLRHSIDPCVIDDKHRSEYNKGIREWRSNPSILMTIAEQAQARFRNKKDVLDAMGYGRPATGRGAR